MRNLGLENVQEAEDFKKMVPGGYVAVIKSVFDNKEKEYLEIELDILQGEFKDYYTELYNSKGFWGLKKYLSYKEAALPMFKAFTTAVKNSNMGYDFEKDYNEKSLEEKRVGIVIGYEEYKGNNGAIKTRAYINKVRSVDKILSGEFEIPKLKELENKEVPDVATPDDDLPF